MPLLSKVAQLTDWFVRMFRWERSPDSYPPDEGPGELTGMYERQLLELHESTDSMRARRRQRSLADAERRVHDGIADAGKVFYDVLGKKAPK